jgi:2-amino-4-hydroxy-6-hydroxymethyldihydropteridine diphosphokinase
VTGPGAIDPCAEPGREVRAFVAIGSNVGDRAAHVDHAFAALGGIRDTRVVARSTVLETDPVGPPGQGPYLNAVAELRTRLSPRALLDAMLAVERERGRDRSREVRFGPRTLDLDLLCWGPAEPGGTARIEADGISVPHPRMGQRAFVLEPLAQLAPDLAERARGSAGVHFDVGPGSRT